MSKHIYYAEIRNKIASEFLNNPELLEAMVQDNNFECKQEGIYSICSEAARIFEAIQHLSGTGNMTTVSRAVHIYADILLEQLQRGERLLIIDLIVMASQTLQHIC